jgi:membrane fusion protein, multidrug efflux system
MTAEVCRRVGGVGALMAALSLAVGCGGASKEAPPAKEVSVPWSRPRVQVVTELEEFTGRTEAVMTVEVRARVTGYLDKAMFKEGTDVKKGDLLFEIDPRTYQAEVDKAQAMVGQYEATVERLGSDYQRARQLMPSRAISPEEVDKISGNRSEAAATVGAARASLRAAKLNLDFTKIAAPLSGRISRRLADPGNLVKADDTILTTIVQLDPIHSYFDIDERTVLRLRRLIHEGKLRSASETAIQVDLGLADEEGYSLKGTIDFRDNRLDPGTGTLRVRVVIPNPDKLLSPGMFMRMKLPVSLPTRSLLVPEEALVNDQGQKALYVINADDKVESREVKIGQLIDGQRVIKSGVTEKDRVVVQGQMSVRPGLKVNPRPAQTPDRAAVKAAQPPSL